MRVLLITSQPPIPSGGGSMLLYKHFCERGNFEISVITDNAQIYQYSVPYNFLLIKQHSIWNRLVRTRLNRSLHSLSHLFFGTRIPKTILKQAQNFKPDIVFTVAGNWSWTARLAKQVALRLNVPLVGSFMDWWYYNQIYSEWAAPFIDKEFRKFYRQCDLALCISDGMKTELGAHPSSTVVYPISSVIRNTQAPQLIHNSRKFTVAFGGNLGGWYGRMMESLIVAAENFTDIQLKIFGFDTIWSKEFDRKARSSGTYGGHLPLEELRRKLEEADALFLIMGFDSACAQIEKTNFKSKFIEYLSFQKPIFMWGAEYCSTVQYAKKFDAAEICTSPDPKAFLETIIGAKTDKNRQAELVRNACEMYNEYLHPDKIHQQFVDSIKALVMHECKA